MQRYNPSTKPSSRDTNAMISWARSQARASLGQSKPRLTALGWAYRQRMLSNSELVPTVDVTM